MHCLLSAFTEALDLLSTKIQQLLTKCCLADLTSLTLKLYVTFALLGYLMLGGRELL